MPAEHALRSPNRLAIALLALLALVLGVLLLGFVSTMRTADRQFELAVLAERQAARVSQIAALSEVGRPATGIARALEDYRQLVEDESLLVKGDGELERSQRDEAAGALLLGSLVADPAATARFRALAARIRSDEGAEVVAARRELDRLRRRTVVFAATLAVAALACAVCAGWLLIRRNRALERAVQARTDRLDAVDRSRRLFFAKASHELRTPVTVLRGEAEVALADPGASREALRQSLGHVIASAAALGHRIDELLGLASADDGQLRLARTPIDLAAVVADAAAEAAPIARSAEVALETRLPDGSLMVTGDARWLRQALLAVIDNGVKFSPLGGTVTVSLARAGGGAVLTVADDGHGVVPAELPRIFDAYYQAEEGRARGGNGLGLALARWVTEQHAGTITAANGADGGCRVQIILPHGAAA